MFCERCKNYLKDCKCEDLENRLDDAVKSGHFDYNKCIKCGKPDLIRASMYITLKSGGAL